jgi:hypothetical protein
MNPRRSRAGFPTSKAFALLDGIIRDWLAPPLKAAIILVALGGMEQRPG